MYKLQEVRKPARNYKYKPDWPAAMKRWDAFWEIASLGRPCIRVTAPQDAKTVVEYPKIASDEERYMNPDYVCARWRDIHANTYFGGEAIPCGIIDMGIYAIGCGPEVVFDAITVYHPQIMRSIDDLAKWQPANCPWKRKLEAVMDKLCEGAAGNYFVSTILLQVPLNDLLYLLIGPDFLMELADDTDKCAAAIEKLFPQWIELVMSGYERINKRLPDQGYAFSWPGLWSRKPVMLTQSDMSCMISRKMFDKYVMRDLDLMAQYFPAIWYHLDGGNARHHLPTLFSRDYIKIIQYVPAPNEPPNGPGHLDFYRAVQAAGRGLDLSVPMENMEYLIRHLKPDGVALDTSARTRAEADKLIENAEKWAGSHCLSTT